MIDGDESRVESTGPSGEWLRNTHRGSGYKPSARADL